MPIPIILKYKEQFPDLIKYYIKDNGGLSDARNYGMRYATGKYMAFLDSDDYVEPNTYELLYNKAEERKLRHGRMQLYLGIYR